jgi:uracil-DNA glycosylase
MLIGQAPGVVEPALNRPFAGRAGKELFRWLASVGIQEAEFRAKCYISAVTRCFPGKSPSGSGDRRPSRAEIDLCRPWLDQQLALIHPRVILLVGGLAIDQYFRGRSLSELVGQRFEQDGLMLVPLPHPSGASRWLNDPANRALLDRALVHVQAIWEEFCR